MDILLWFQGLRSPALDWLMLLITQFGQQTPLIALICLIYWCIDKRLAQLSMFSLFVGGLVNQFLKILLCVPRPWLLDARLLPVEAALHGASGYSFPSGHTASATAVFGAMALCAKRRWIRALLAALIALVGVSRVYLGVHTPWDVLASWALGAALLLLTWRALRMLLLRPSLDWAIVAVGLLLSALLAVYAQAKTYPAGDDGLLVLDSFKTAGAAAGMLLGWLVERRLVRFNPKAPWAVQILKYALGMALVLGTQRMPLPLPERAAALLRYLLLALFATGLWPLLFSRFGKNGNP